MELGVDRLSHRARDLVLLRRKRRLQMMGEARCDGACGMLEDPLAHHHRGEDRVVGGEHGAALLGHQPDELLAFVVTEHAPLRAFPSEARTEAPRRAAAAPSAGVAGS